MMWRTCAFPRGLAFGGSVATTPCSQSCRDRGRGCVSSPLLFPLTIRRLPVLFHRLFLRLFRCNLVFVKQFHNRVLDCQQPLGQHNRSREEFKSIFNHYPPAAP